MIFCAFVKYESSVKNKALIQYYDKVIYLKMNKKKKYVYKRKIWLSYVLNVI